MTKIDTIQHNAALTITGAIISTSHTKLYNELGSEFFKFRRRFQKLSVL